MYQNEGEYFEDEPLIQADTKEAALQILQAMLEANPAMGIDQSGMNPQFKTQQITPPAVGGMDLYGHPPMSNAPAMAPNAQPGGQIPTLRKR